MPSSNSAQQTPSHAALEHRPPHGEAYFSMGALLATLDFRAALGAGLVDIRSWRGVGGEVPTRAPQPRSMIMLPVTISALLRDAAECSRLPALAPALASGPHFHIILRFGAGKSFGEAISRAATLLRGARRGH